MRRRNVTMPNSVATRAGRTRATASATQMFASGATQAGTASSRHQAMKSGNGSEPSARMPPFTSIAFCSLSEYAIAYMPMPK